MLRDGLNPRIRNNYNGSNHRNNYMDSNLGNKNKYLNSLWEPKITEGIGT